MIVMSSMLLSSPVRISSAGMLSMSDDLPVFRELTAA